MKIKRLYGKQYFNQMTKKKSRKKPFKILKITSCLFLTFSNK